MARRSSAGLSVLPVLILALVLGAGLYFLITAGVISNPFTKKAKVQLQTQYQNPFDKNAQYVNPFATYKNPFDTLKTAK